MSAASSAMARPAPVRLAMLNGMADRDIARSIALQASWGVRDLDLKDSVFGKEAAELEPDEALRVAALAAEHGMDVHCLSTHLCGWDLADGEAAFRARLAERLPRAIVAARALRPRLVRLLAPQWRERPDAFATPAALAAHPWLAAAYRESIDALTAAGFAVVIENEVGRCILRTPADVEALFAAIDRPGRVRYTYDVQNLWEMGTPPSVAVYERLRPLIAYVHLKGGIAAPDGTLAWRSGLRGATWPVAALVARVAADGSSPVICLNPSHGAKRPLAEDDRGVADDLAFLRTTLPETVA